MFRRPVLLLMPALLFAACGGDVSVTTAPDAGRGDSGSGSALDASTAEDAAIAEDAGAVIEDGGEAPLSDAGLPPEDAGTLPECVSGQSETVPCGACETGTRKRICQAGTWAAWSGCVGEDSRFPYTRSGDPVCPPYNRPAVFFSPHPDDESLAMAGAIRAHVLAGRDVFIELLTKGTASGVRTVINNGATCAWHSGTHSYNLTPEQFGEARVRELTEAISPLGIEGFFVSDFEDGALQASEVNGRIQFWLDYGGQGLSLKGTAGAEDPTSPGGSPHRDHATLWNALLASGFGDVRGYLVSHYVTGAGSPGATADISAVCDDKRNALGAYKIWSPAAGHYGIGYHSVPRLFDAANTNCVEYVVYP